MYKTCNINLSRVVVCLCVRTIFHLPCVCLFLKKKNGLLSHIV